MHKWYQIVLDDGCENPGIIREGKQLKGKNKNPNCFMQSCVIIWHISTNEGGFPTWCVWKTCYTHRSTHKLSGDWAKIACLVVYPRCNCLSLVYVLQSINGSYSGWWSPSFLEKVYTLKEWHVNCSKRSRILTKQRE